MKIKATATVNAGSDEFDYPLFEVTDIHKLMHNLLEEHPTMSSVVLCCLIIDDDPKVVDHV